MSLDDDVKYVELEYLGGTSRFEKSHLVFKKSNVTNTLIVEREQFAIKNFHWIEKETRNIVMAAFGFLIGFLLGLAIGQNLVAGLIGGIIGAALLGWKQDKSMIVFTLLDDEKEVILYARCSEKEFRAISDFL